MDTTIEQVLNNLLNNIDTAINQGDTHSLDILSSTYQRVMSVTFNVEPDKELLAMVLSKLLSAIDQFNIDALSDREKAYQRIVSTILLTQQIELEKKHG